MGLGLGLRGPDLGLGLDNSGAGFILCSGECIICRVLAAPSIGQFDETFFHLFKLKTFDEDKCLTETKVLTL